MAEHVRKRVLILEDEMLIALELQELLQDLGCEVVGPASSCKAALELIDTEEIDAAILDFIVGQEDCRSVAAALTARGLPWALATGLDAVAVEQTYSAAMSISKPYGSEQVRDLLIDLLGIDLPPLGPTSASRERGRTPE